MQKFVLCLTLLSVFGTISADKAEADIIDQLSEFPVRGGFHDLDAEGLKGLEQELKTLFDKMGATYDDFDVNFKRVISGRSQVVAGTNYELNVEVTPKADPSVVKNCEVNYFRNIGGEFDRAYVKCDHKDKTFSYLRF